MATAAFDTSGLMPIYNTQGIGGHTADGMTKTQTGWRTPGSGEMYDMTGKDLGLPVESSGGFFGGAGGLLATLAAAYFAPGLGGGAADPMAAASAEATSAYGGTAGATAAQSAGIDSMFTGSAGVDVAAGIGGTAALDAASLEAMAAYGGSAAPGASIFSAADAGINGLDLNNGANSLVSSSVADSGSSYLDQLKKFFQGRMTGGGSSGLGLLSGGLGTLGGLQMLMAGRKLSSQANSMQDPNLGGYQKTLADTYANPTSYLNSPDYQATYAQGLQALQRQMAAGGYGGTGADPGSGGGSGNFATAAQSYGQNAAQQYLGNYRAGLQPLTQPNTNLLQLQGAGTMQQIGGLGALSFGASKLGL